MHNWGKNEWFKLIQPSPKSRVMQAQWADVIRRVFGWENTFSNSSNHKKTENLLSFFKSNNIQSILQVRATITQRPIYNSMAGWFYLKDHKENTLPIETVN